MAVGIRDRFRAQMVDEIKQHALRQLAEGGAQALSVNAIAKELGVSGPALYRYFAGRDALLTELILDAYADLSAALQAADPDLTAVADAYRAWALANPHRYRLLFAAPPPGHHAHDERLVAASRHLMDALVARLPAGPQPAAALAGQLADWAQRRQRPGMDPGTSLLGITAWSRMHGFVSLEIEGNWSSMGLDPEMLFAVEVAALRSGR